MRVTSLCRDVIPNPYAAGGRVRDLTMPIDLQRRKKERHKPFSDIVISRRRKIPLCRCAAVRDDICDIHHRHRARPW